MADWNGFEKNGVNYIPNDATARAALENKISKSQTAGLVKNDGTIDTNTYAKTSDLPDITGKADKVASATNGNFAGLDANGNLTDSGKKASDFATASSVTAIEGKIPSTASSSNKLATADDVASCVTWSANAVLGAKNFFDASKAEFKDGGLTCTKNVDGSISIGAGTTTSELNYPNNASYANCYELEPSTEYIFSIGSAVTNLRLRVFCKTTSSSDWTIIANEQNVENIHFTTPASFYAIWVRIDCDSNKAISAATLYPMIRLASDTDPTYAPYAMTNQQLTEQVTPVVLGSNDDLNNITKMGLYIVAGLPANTPDNKGFYALLVYPVATDGMSVIQVALHGENAIYYRRRSGSPISWKPWVKVEGTVIS